MKPILFLIPFLLLLLVPPGHSTVPPINPPTTGLQLFYDDFTQSGFPSQWSSGAIIGINNASQTGGYLTTTILGNALTFNNAYSIRMIANNTSPVIASTDNSKFVQIVYKMQPFNLTNPTLLSYNTGSGTPSTFPILADIQLGLSSEATHGGTGSFPRNSLYFELMESTVPLNRLDSNLPSQKQAAVIAMNGGPANAATPFTPDVLVCCPTNLGIVYNGQNAPFDLGQMHTFSIQVNLNTTAPSTEYVRYQIDNDGWMTFWESACTCIGSGGVTSVYPFFTLTYLVGNSAGILTSPFVISQSLASQIDYVAAYNYQPALLPQGQLLSSGAIPPKTPIIPYGTAKGYQPGSLPQFMQYYANVIGGGNVYAGGFFLTGMILTVTSIVLGAATRKTGRGLPGFGFMWALSCMGLAFFMLYAGIVPIILPALQVTFSVAILFGVFRLHGPGGGGEVTE